MHNIVFKRQDEYPDIEREFTKLQPELMQIVEVFASLAWILYRDYLVVTRIYQASDDGSSHHKYQPASGPYRYIDIAIPYNMGKEGKEETIREMLNKLFPHSRGLETVPPLDHGTAPHFHLQV